MVAPLANVTVTIVLIVVPEGNDTVGGGTDASITMVCDVDGSDSIPPELVAVAIITYVAFTKADGVIDHRPLATVAVPILFDPSNSVIVCPVTPDPIIVGVVSLVGVDIVLMTGIEAAAALTTTVCASDAADVFSG